MKIVFDTLGKLADAGYRLDVSCVACRRHAWVTYQDLAARFGPDHTFAIVDKLRCAKCGGREVDVRLHPPTAP